MTVLELINGMSDSQRDNVAAALQIHDDLEYGEKESYATSFAWQLKDLYLPRLKLHCGQFETLFNSLEEFHEYHCEWLRTNSPTWGRYFRTMVVKYNLIHNTDRTQEETTITSTTGEGYSNASGSSSGNNSNKHTADNSTSGSGSGSSNKTNNGTALHQLSAANQTDFHNKHKDTTEGGENGSFTEENSGTEKRSETDTGSSSSSSEQEQNYTNESMTEVTHRIRAYGNIGVTTNQQMLAEERRHLEFNLLDKIIGEFKKEMCIMLY